MFVALTALVLADLSRVCVFELVIFAVHAFFKPATSLVRDYGLLVVATFCSVFSFYYLRWVYSV